MSLQDNLRDFTSAVEHKMSGAARSIQNLRDEINSMQNPNMFPIESKLDREHHQEFREWLVKGDHAVKRLREVELEVKREQKTDTVNIGTALQGGNMLPKILSTRVYAMARTVNPWLDPAILGAEPVNGSDYHEVLTLSEATSSRGGESATRSQTSTSNFRDIKPLGGEYYALTFASKESRDDVQRMENTLVSDAASQIGASLANDIFNGSGSSGQVKGFASATPVTTSDSASPMRAAAALQYVPTLSIGSPVSAPTIEDVENLFATFAEEYLLDDSFAVMMRPSTYRSILRFANPTEAPFNMPRNPTLFGIPVRFTSAMPAVTANAFPIAAGAWRRGYALASRGNLEIVRDQITTVGTIKFWVSQRFLGIPRDNNAIKLIKAAVS
jgi:HK97 family phage major capsid protein